MNSVPNIHVGKPPSNTKEWSVFYIHYNGFEGLPTTMGVPVYSPEFTCFGHEWRLQIYPGGRYAATYGTTLPALFIKHISDESISGVQFGCSIKDKHHKGKSDVSYDALDFTPLVPNETSTFCLSHAWDLRRSDLIKHLVDGALIIEVRMRSAAFTATCLPFFIPENPISRSILAMFNDEESADILFVVDDEPVRNTRKKTKATTTLYGHRCIMQKCTSAVLGELCKSEEDDATATVAITNVTPEIFKHLLYYIYGGKVADEDMNENATDIIDAADKYGIVGLKLEAEASLVTNTTITFENAIGNLLYADSKNCALLKEAVMDFIAENSKEAAHKLSFGNVPGHVIPDLLTAVNRKGSEGGTIPDTNDLNSMRVNALRKMLHKKGLDVDGSREMMIARLEEA